MEYRRLPHGDEQISVIGVGGGSLPEDVEKATEILNNAIDNGINFFDLAPSYQPPFHAEVQLNVELIPPAHIDSLNNMRNNNFCRFAKPQYRGHSVTYPG